MLFDSSFCLSALSSCFSFFLFSLYVFFYSSDITFWRVTTKAKIQHRPEIATTGQDGIVQRSKGGVKINIKHGAKSLSKAKWSITNLRWIGTVFILFQVILLPAVYFIFLFFLLLLLWLFFSSSSSRCCPVIFRARESGLVWTLSFHLGFFLSEWFFFIELHSFFMAGVTSDVDKLARRWIGERQRNQNSVATFHPSRSTLQSKTRGWRFLLFIYRAHSRRSEIFPNSMKWLSTLSTSYWFNWLFYFFG